MHAKTGTAEVYGKQTTSVVRHVHQGLTVVMTISQGGTGSGASGPAVRKIYDALYGVNTDGDIDRTKALLPKPEARLPKIDKDGTIVPQRDRACRDMPSASPSPSGQSGQSPNASPPGRHPARAARPRPSQRGRAAAAPPGPRPAARDTRELAGGERP